MHSLEQKIFQVTADSFQSTALEVFRFQAANCPVYRDYLAHLSCRPETIQELTAIPFMPIDFFKKHQIISGKNAVQAIFESSGTTGQQTSKHFVTKTTLYDQSLRIGFEYFLGNPSQYCFLALLPNYLERSESSLIYMVKQLMAESQHPANGYFLYEHKHLKETLEQLERQEQKTILFGVSFALLDFAEEYSLDLSHTLIMETGGMKGRREEITRETMHQILCQAFGTQQIHSEYGMTELLSQAYSLGGGRYQTPPWMRILTRELNDPFSFLANNQTGGINIIDLANLYSCSFIETQDLGKVFSDKSFTVLGRFDHSDIRGCNLMIS